MLRRFLLIFFFSGLPLFAYNQTRNLEFYLKEGIHNSPLLNDYRNQINSAIADSLIIGAAKKPFLETKSQLLYSPYYHNFGYDEVITNGGIYTAVLSVTQNIFNKKENRNKYNSVDIKKQLVNNSSMISIDELNKLITEQYPTAFSGYSDLIFNKTFLELSKRENIFVKQFVKNGVYKQTDYLALLVETQSQEILVKQLESQYRKDLSSLNQLCGLNDSSWYELVKPELKINGTPDISKSPAFLQYKIDSVRIENEKAAVDIRYRPKFSWFADAGFLTSNPWNFYSHFGYSAGISLNIPVYDGKQRSIEKQKLEINQDTRKTYENNYQKQYFQQIRQLTNELKALNEMQASLDDQLNTSDQLVKALKEQLEAGIIQMTEYINAIKNYKTIYRNVNLINIQKLQVVNELNFLLTR
ncbi:MAG: TolC family protein [Bacteroidales bacterium]|jgi:outer membrane protein TolC